MWAVLLDWLRWVKAWAIPGLGMFSEAYVIFAVGNIRAIYEKEYPDCWGSHDTECPTALLQSITYTQLLGIIVGMITVSALADHVGRRIASILNAVCMFLGVCMLVGASGSNPTLKFSIYTCGLFVFGLGVGGEYPVASATAAEKFPAPVGDPGRGRAVMLVFSMQGVGTLVNALVFIILLWAFGQTSTSYSPDALDWVWRLQYGLGAVMILWILIYRILYVKDPEVWVKHRATSTPRPLMRRLRSMWKHYWPRLIGTGLGWFVWDVCFYGNRLFQSSFIEVVQPGASVFGVLEWTLLNAAVACVGYYAAAYSADKPWMGRLRMQLLGFAGITACFMACGIWFDTLEKPSGIHWFQTLYYFSSFIGQLGPNATTWLLPAELFPTEFRAMAHGTSAAAGKLGALCAGIMFHSLGNQGRFLACGVCGIVGFIVTALFVADVTDLDLRETDKHYDANSGTRNVNINPKHLSLYERCTARDVKELTSLLASP